MRLVAITLSFVSFSTVLFGQAGTGTVTGIVSDPAGAVVARANIGVKRGGGTALSASTHGNADRALHV
jgi:hypothetical protein